METSRSGNNRREKTSHVFLSFLRRQAFRSYVVLLDRRDYSLVIHPPNPPCGEVLALALIGLPALRHICQMEPLSAGRLL